jgi:hypothetical protein
MLRDISIVFEIAILPGSDSVNQLHFVARLLRTFVIMHSKFLSRSVPVLLTVMPSIFISVHKAKPRSIISCSTGAPKRCFFYISFQPTYRSEVNKYLFNVIQIICITK